LDKSTTGDAIIAALQVLTVMVEQKKALHELVADFKLLPNVLVNVRLNAMFDPYSVPALAAEFEKADAICFCFFLTWFFLIVLNMGFGSTAINLYPLFPVATFGVSSSPLVRRDVWYEVWYLYIPIPLTAY
ncbi:hypothetical protein LH495_29685, partial [Klebsiella pneumoniae]|nr:hypothetical protein [Klebsiella pneumoniae]